MKLLWLFAALLALTGCPHRVEFGPQGEITDAKQMLALLAKQDTRFVTMQGDAKFKVESPQVSGTVSQYLAVTRPAGLHIETFNFFGKPLSVLVSDGDHFQFYDAEKNVFYEGDATPEVMSRFIPLQLAPEEAVALMLGQVPRVPAQDGKLVVNAEKHRYELTLEAQSTGGLIRQVLFIDTKTLDVQRSAITGANAYNLALDDYKDEPGGRFPHEITLEAKASNITLTYKYADVKVNAAPDLSLFHMDAPPSAKRVQLDAKGNPTEPGSTPGGPSTGAK